MHTFTFVCTVALSYGSTNCERVEEQNVLSVMING